VISVLDSHCCYHQGHPGILRTKVVARSYVWWPSLGRDIDNVVSNCVVCGALIHKRIFMEVKPACRFLLLGMNLFGLNNVN